MTTRYVDVVHIGGAAHLALVCIVCLRSVGVCASMRAYPVVANARATVIVMLLLYSGVYYIDAALSALSKMRSLVFNIWNCTDCAPPRKVILR